MHFKKCLLVLICVSQSLLSLDLDSFLEFTFSKDRVKGPLKIENQALKTLNVEGPLEVINCRIEKLLVQGPFIAKNAELETVYAEGLVTLENCRIESIHVIGNIESINSTFLDTLHAKSSNITLRNSTAEKIIIESTGANEQVLNLAGKTIINGNIIFLSSNGLVKAEKEVVMKGTLEGLK